MSAVMDINLYDLLQAFPVYRGGAAESLIDKLVAAGPGTDPWRLDLTDEERRILGHVLATEPEVPGVEEIQSAIACHARRRLSRNMETINREIAAAEERGDSEAVCDLLILKQITRSAEAVVEGF
jgi:hypothetical protein